MNLSAEQFRTLMSNKQAAKDRFEGKQKKSKYNNVRVEVDGEKFDSNLIPVDTPGEEHHIEVCLGQVN